MYLKSIGNTPEGALFTDWMFWRSIDFLMKSWHWLKPESILNEAEEKGTKSQIFIGVS